MAPDCCRALLHDPRLAWAIVSISLAGVMRGATGFGQALIFVPLAGLAYPPSVAVPLLWLVDAMVTPFLLRPHLRRLRAAQPAERAEIAPLAVGGIIPLPAGVWVLKHLDPVLLRWTICGLVLLMTAAIAAGWRLQVAATWRWSLGVGSLSGLAGGATGMSGPPLILFWLGRNTDAGLIRSNIFLYLWVNVLASLAVAARDGLLSRPLLLIGLVMAPAYALATLAGNVAFHRAINRPAQHREALFRRLALGLCAASACVGLPIWH